jgi:polyhydroxyalkanoate synthesis regulator phasin
MARPPFALTDDQARDIARGVTDLDARFPLDSRSHRPFVRAFIALIRDVTGKLYSPTIYRRLLDAYAPARRPSTETLAVERAYADKLADRRVTVGESATEAAFKSPDDLTFAIQDAVTEALDHHLLGMQRMTEQVNAAQLEFYQHQLSQVEAGLAQLRSQLSAMNAELAAARQAADQYKAEAEATRAVLSKNVETIEALTRSSDGARTFALMAIEEARGETRIWKERFAELQIERQKDAQLLDSMRRQAFANPPKFPR